jgi:hypothetical protein
MHEPSRYVSGDKHMPTSSGVVRRGKRNRIFPVGVQAGGNPFESLRAFNHVGRHRDGCKTGRDLRVVAKALLEYQRRAFPLNDIETRDYEESCQRNGTSYLVMAKKRAKQQHEHQHAGGPLHLP